MRIFTLLVCLFLGSAWTTSALSADRFALVIGNDSYEALPPLKKAVNDARAVGDALEGLGFTVLRGENQTLRNMQDSLFDLSERLSPGDIVFLFYAGHGVALGGGNYLLPIDTPLPQGGKAEGRVRFAGLAEADIIAQVKEAGAQLTIVVLDACRDNPFATAGTRSVGGSRGLQRPPESRGVFGIYSAGFGQSALDRLSETDENPNSVFTRALVPALADPSLSLVDIAYKVNEDVERLAKTVGHEQNPAHYDEARGRDVYLSGGKREAAEAPAPLPEPAPAGARPCTEAKAHYDEALRLRSASALHAHVVFYGDCAYAPFAEEALAALLSDPGAASGASDADIGFTSGPAPTTGPDGSQSVYESLQLDDETEKAEAKSGRATTKSHPILDSPKLPDLPEDSASLKGGATGRGWLGAEVGPVTDAVATAQKRPTTEGALVRFLAKNAPAMLGGIHRDDIIIDLGGTTIGSPRELIRALGAYRAGATIQIKVWRDGKVEDILVVLGEMPRA